MGGLTVETTRYLLTIWSVGHCEWTWSWLFFNWTGCSSSERTWGSEATKWRRGSKESHIWGFVGFLPYETTKTACTYYGLPVGWCRTLYACNKTFRLASLQVSTQTALATKTKMYLDVDVHAGEALYYSLCTCHRLPQGSTSAPNGRYKGIELAVCPLLGEFKRMFQNQWIWVGEVRSIVQWWTATTGTS